MAVENKTEQNLSYKNEQQKCTFPILRLFCRKKLIVPNLLTFETKSQFRQTKVACEKLAAAKRLKIAQVAQPATEFLLQEERDCARRNNEKARELIKS